MDKPDPAMGCVRLFAGLALAVMFTGLLAACGGGASTSTTTPPNPSSPSITTTSLPAATIGVAYTNAVNASGGTAPFTWSIASGAPPAGLSLGASTTSSVAFQGAPTMDGTFSFTIQVKDASNLTGTANLSITVNSANQLGSATGVQVTCPASTVTPPVVGSACYTVTISCPGVAQYAADIKVTDPSGSSVGTVIYTTGGGGNQLYEDQFVYGNTAINNVVQAGYTAVQTNFNDTSLGSTGWLDGPGGPLMLSCRWATLAQWVHDNIRASNTAFCATGNSGGAGVIAYSLTRFGGDQLFNYVQPTSGPPFTRIDYGCRCSQQTMQTTDCAGVQGTCYGTDANMFLDPAYKNMNCSDGSLTAQTAQWQADSILSSDGKSQLDYKIPVHFIFGSQDMGSGSALAVLWERAITSTHTNRCIADGPHKIADVVDGAQAVANDMIANCH